MDIVELLPRLYFLRFPVGHVYLWVDDDGLTVVDSGIAGSGPEIELANPRGARRSDDRRLPPAR